MKIPHATANDVSAVRSLLARNVAIKIRHLDPEANRKKSSEDSFLQEARELAKLLSSPAKPTENKSFAKTTHRIELEMMLKLNDVVKSGYILAKAVRLACIAQPMDIEAFDLAENINVDDVISSFVLKACLFSRLGANDYILKCKSPVEVSAMINECLINSLKNNLVKSLYSGETPVNCTKCFVVRGCCKRREFMLSMSRNFLLWMSRSSSSGISLCKFFLFARRPLPM